MITWKEIFTRFIVNNANRAMEKRAPGSCMLNKHGERFCAPHAQLFITERMKFYEGLAVKTLFCSTPGGAPAYLFQNTEIFVWCAPTCHPNVHTRDVVGWVPRCLKQPTCDRKWSTAVLACGPSQRHTLRADAPSGEGTSLTGQTWTSVH